jgi:phosphohistidine phosphatase
MPSAPRRKQTDGQRVFLYVMRHGPAEDRAPSGRDRDRALTPAGRIAVRRAAEQLREQRGSNIPRVLTSPRVRAEETAAIVAEVAAGPTLVVEPTEHLEPDGSPSTLIPGLRSQGTDVLLVGHQPDVEILVRTLAGQATPSGFHTAMIVAMESGPDESVVGGWDVRFVIDPRR